MAVTHIRAKNLAPNPRRRWGAKIIKLVFIIPKHEAVIRKCNVIFYAVHDRIMLVLVLWFSTFCKYTIQTSCHRLRTETSINRPCPTYCDVARNTNFIRYINSVCETRFLNRRKKTSVVYYIALFEIDGRITVLKCGGVHVAKLSSAVYDYPNKMFAANVFRTATVR